MPFATPEEILDDIERHCEQAGLNPFRTHEHIVRCRRPGDPDPSNRDRVKITACADKVLTVVYTGASPDPEAKARFLSEIGYEIADLTPRTSGRQKWQARYEYPDGHRTYRFEGKRFKQEVPKGAKGKPRQPYHAEVLADLEPGAVVLVAEGEKCVRRCEEDWGLPVITCGGAGKSHLFDLSCLAGHHVTIVADADYEAIEKGNEPEGWADAVQKAAHAERAGAASVRVVQAYDGCKDLFDHIESGWGFADLREPDAEQMARVEAAYRVSLGRHAVCDRLSDIEFIEPQWLWKSEDGGRIALGSLGIAAGREGKGKSSWTIWLMGGVTRGTLPGALEGTPRNVLYVSTEMSWGASIKWRMDVAGVDQDRVYRLRIGQQRTVDGKFQVSTLDLSRDLGLIREAVRDHDIALVVIDPLLSAMGAQTDAHNAQQVREVLEGLVDLADETQAVVVGVAHFNKSGGSDAAQLITGSGAFKDVPRFVLAFGANEDETERVMTQVKNSDGDKGPSLAFRLELVERWTGTQTQKFARFAFCGKSDRSVSDLLRDAQSWRSGETRAPKRTALDVIVDHIREHRNAAGECLASEVIDAGLRAGFKEQTLRNTRTVNSRTIGTRKDIDGGPWWWSVLGETGVTEGESGDQAEGVPSGSRAQGERENSVRSSVSKGSKGDSESDFTYRQANSGTRSGTSLADSGSRTEVLSEGGPRTESVREIAPEHAFDGRGTDSRTEETEAPRARGTSDCSCARCAGPLTDDEPTWYQLCEECTARDGRPTECDQGCGEPMPEYGPPYVRHVECDPREQLGVVA